MRPFDRLTDYLAHVERRLRWLTLARGVAASAATALFATLAAVLVANQFHFSEHSVTAARVFLFMALAFALALALIVPILSLNRRRAARAAERHHPAFEERLLTFTERAEADVPDPFLELLAGDTLEVAQSAEPATLAPNAWLLSFSSAAAAALGVLLWLIFSGPGFLGYGTQLLWAGYPKGEVKPFYDIAVEPGNRTVRRKSDQLVLARLIGFNAQKVRLMARYAAGAKWEEAEMRPRPGGSTYEFLFAGLPESLDYYVEAGGMRSRDFHLNVVDLPSVKSIRVTYHYPAWTGQRDFVEFPGGDLRAVEGTTAEVAITTDRPLTSNASLLLDDGTRIDLRQGPSGERIADVPIQKDGLYHVAAAEAGDDVRLSEDYFIEAQKDHPPEIKIARPSRDFRASPIEEVTIAVEASDDFGLHAVDLHYSVNGGAEKTLPLLPQKGSKRMNGETTLALEDFKLQPGDVVAYYAVARDARVPANTDMFFIEAQPFEREYTQSQQSGGSAGGAGADEEQGKISQRQKEIIAATWNQLKGGAAERKGAAENAGFLAGVQNKLREQAKSLAERMRSRQLAGAGDGFKQFIEDMDKAAEAMGPASDQLKGSHWQDALGPEQKALQHLLRAEATFRNIQVAFGNQKGGAGGGGGGAQRDLEGLFDLELDTEKNQYESGRQSAQSAEQRQKEIDEALQKLEQLAKRQQQLAEQQKQNQQRSEQRWQQELLRREAEELQKQLQQMAQSSQQPGQGQGQQSSQQSSQQQSSSSSSTPSRQQSSTQQQQAERLRQTLERLQQATKDMRQSTSQQLNGGQAGEAEARRAADRLKEATDSLSRLRQQQSGGQMDDLVRQAEALADRQQQFDRKMRQTFGKEDASVTPDQSQQMANEKQGIAGEAKQLEQQMQRAARDLAGSDRKASTQVRDALAEMQQEELPSRMQRSADLIRSGMGGVAVMREATTTQAVNQVRDQLKDAQRSLGKGRDSKDADGRNAARDRETEQALANVERLRRRLEQARQAGQQSGQQGRQQQQLSREGGQQQGQRGQGGQQPSQQQGQGQQPGGQQPGGQQAGGQQAGGQQPGGPQGGRQQGGQQAGGARQAGGQAFGINEGAGRRYDGLPNGPAGIANTMRDTTTELGRLEQQLADDPTLARQVRDLTGAIRQLDPRLYDNELIAERIRQQVLQEVEQVEMQLRRKLEDTSGTTPRSQTAGQVPPGYADAVAEYFRKLSKSK